MFTKAGKAGAVDFADRKDVLLVRQVSDCQFAGGPTRQAGLQILAILSIFLLPSNYPHR